MGGLLCLLGYCSVHHGLPQKKKAAILKRKNHPVEGDQNERTLP